MTRLCVTDNAGSARRGSLKLRSASVDTPFFMPVATRGIVRYVPTELIADLGYQVLLSNTYHLMLRPGVEVIQQMGGLNAFTGFQGSSLTDSGGFQIMSLEASITTEGARFRNVYDGSWVTLTPEQAMVNQQRIGADIAMALDVCTQLPSSRDQLEANLRLTSEWAERSRLAHTDSTQALFGIIQGGIDLELRRQSTEAITALDFDGYAVGGLAVGESHESTLEAVRTVVDGLPADKPRYLMGVGDPYLLAHATALGIDMFDCVSPTRIARHGTALTDQGPVRVKGLPNRGLDEPLESGCGCRVCQRVSRGLLHHLSHVDTESAGALLSLHNLAFQFRLISRLRQAIVENTVEEVLADVDSVWSRPAIRTGVSSD
ncbi:queuine tRNA-ribosyltransferase [Ferrimicrobium acidiphilum DSM 19497]|uniref:Queuine tRNA-ribosyltransferase n=1 Tax=Ferrimicrobium acidiphilum DSM 19497 TaxID=1121877 RepID=A0A0D8FYV2_9ACTN|nr:queuine tRNA-ribosyltransferase [Ferrimicrobium acidiphilum DSM 19497]